MGKDVSIVFRAEDQYTQSTTRMGDATKKFSKEAEEAGHILDDYRKRQADVDKQMAKTQTALAAAADEIKKAKKAYSELNDEVSEKNLEEAYQKQNKLTSALKEQRQAAGDTASAIRQLGEQQRKTENASGGGSMLGQLGQAGLYQMAGTALAGVANTIVGSAMGDDVGNMFSSALSGAGSGAAIGTMIGGPGVGTAIGAVAGTVVGLVEGATQVFQKEDDAFKSYVQDQYSTIKEQQNTNLTGGSTIAGGREQTQLAFNTLLGDKETASAYLEQVRDMAAKTNYTYDEITGYTKSLLNSFQPDEIMDVLMTMSDATAGLSLSSADVDQMISGMSKMKLTGKATQEYLNFFTERGVNTYDAIAQYRTQQGQQTDASDVTTLVSKGKITGQDAVDAILAYMSTNFKGLSDDLAGSYAGMVNNLGDIQDDLASAIGDAYNEGRKKGVGDDMDAYGGALGDAMKEANTAIGGGRAYAENLEGQYLREARSALFLGEKTTLEGFQDKQKADLQAMHEEYTSLMDAYKGGDEEAGIKIEALKSSVEAMAQEVYDASDVSKLVASAERDLITTIQENTAALKSYGPGYGISKLFSLGMVSATVGQRYDDAGKTITSTSTSPDAARRGMGNAFGLARVPYDNFPALLHEGERVLTASQARQADRGGGAVNITVTGNTFTGTGEDMADKVARKIAAEVSRARMLAVPQ